MEGTDLVQLDNGLTLNRLLKITGNIAALVKVATASAFSFTLS